MRAIRKVAATDRAVICTIHQPSTYIFEMFDALLLLKKGGQPVFFGPLGENFGTLISYLEVTILSALLLALFRRMHTYVRGEGAVRVLEVPTLFWGTQSIAMYPARSFNLRSGGNKGNGKENAPYLARLSAPFLVFGALAFAGPRSCVVRFFSGKPTCWTLARSYRSQMWKKRTFSQLFQNCVFPDAFQPLTLQEGEIFRPVFAGGITDHVYVACTQDRASCMCACGYMPSGQDFAAARPILDHPDPPPPRALE